MIIIIFLIIITLSYKKELFYTNSLQDNNLSDEKKILYESIDNNKTKYWKTFLPLIFKQLIFFILTDKLNNKNQIIFIFNNFIKFYETKDESIINNVKIKINNLNNKIYKDELIKKIGGYFKVNSLNNRLNLEFIEIEKVNNPFEFKMTLEKFIKLFKSKDSE